MSLFKKPKRKFRQREFNADDSDNEQDDKELSSNKTGSGKNDQKGKVSSHAKVPMPVINSSIITSKSLLSFNDDEEDGGGEIFKVKKSSVSRRLLKMKNKEKKNKEKGNNEDKRMEQRQPALIVKQTNPVKVVSDKLNGQDIQETSDSDDNEPSRPDDPVRKALECGAIPDAAMIHAAKKQRQQARELGSSADFVALDEPTNNNESRLVRDDEHDVSDEEEGEGRISFSVNHKENERAKVVEAFLEAQKRDEDSDCDKGVEEELQKWEQVQIRKGVSIPQLQQHDSGHNGANDTTNNLGVPSYKTSHEMYRASPPAPQHVNLDVKLPTAPLESITTAMIKLRLQDRLTTLREVNRAHTIEMDKLQDDMVDSQTEINRLEDSGPLVAAKFSFYQEMRGYVTDLVECLNEKVVVVNALEERMHKLLSDRSIRLAKRRQQDCKEQAEEFSPMVTKSSVQVLPTDPDKQRRIAEREGRRIRRRRNRENHLRIGEKHHDGMSSDDEEDRTIVGDYNASTETILRDSHQVFSDVNDDFGSLGQIRIWFERWKWAYSDTYSEAYIPLCLPKIFGPFIRIELLSWNPLEQVRNIETMQWYRLLLDYGCKNPSQFDESDPDNSLIPLIVEKVILPKLTELVSRVWDPLSSSQTTRLTNLLCRLCDDYPTITDSSSYTTNLLKAIVNRIKKTLEEDVFVPLYPRQLLENRTFGGLSFFQRQLWSCVKLLRNILLWDVILAEQPLLELSINGLLNRYMILGLQNSPVNQNTLEKAKIISSSFPESWFVEDVDGNKKPLPQLAMFCRFLKSTAEFAASDKGNSIDIPNSKEFLKDILKILVSIGERQQAQILAKQFSVI